MKSLHVLHATWVAQVDYKEEVTENLICFRLKPSPLFWDYDFKMTLVGRAAFPGSTLYG